MGKTFLGVETWTDAQTTPACATADSEFPATNLLTSEKTAGDRFRTADASEMVLTLDRTGRRDVFNFVGALYGNQGERASWRVRARNGGAAGALVLDTAHGWGQGLRVGDAGDPGFALGSSAAWNSITDFTIEARILPYRVRRCGLGVFAPVATGNAARVSMREDGAIRFYGVSTSDPLRGNLISTTLAQVGVPLRWSVTYDATAGRMRLYVNGVLEASATGISSLVDSPEILLSNFIESLNFEGIVQDFRLWDVERSASEIAGAIAAPLAGTEPNLVAYWKLDGDYTNELPGVAMTPTGGQPIFSYPERFWWSPDVGFETYRHGVFLFPPGVAADFIEVSIVDPDNTAGHQSLGRLFVSAGWVTERGRKFGARIPGLRGYSEKTRLEGCTATVGQPNRASSRFTVLSTSKADAMQAYKLGRLARDDREVCIAHDYDDEEWRHAHFLCAQLGSVQEVTEVTKAAGGHVYEYSVDATEL